MTAAGISRALAERATALVADLLPGGHREGHEWRAGSIAGEAGSSLGVHLVGSKAGVWSDFATGAAGDALDLVCAVRGVEISEALVWSRRWLGLDDGKAELPKRREPRPKTEPKPNQDSWRRSWNDSRPIAGTHAATYLAARR